MGYNFGVAQMYVLYQKPSFFKNGPFRLTTLNQFRKQFGRGRRPRGVMVRQIYRAQNQREATELAAFLERDFREADRRKWVPKFLKKRKTYKGK